MNTLSMMQRNNRADNISMLERQQPLFEQYIECPEAAVVIDYGGTQSSETPVKGVVLIIY